MEEWKEYKASEFCESVTDGTHDSPKSKDKGFYLITSKHLKDSYIDFASAKFISREDYQKVIQRSKVEQYDVLFSMIGTIGNTLRVTSPKIEFAVKNMGIFKFGGNNLNSKWFYYWLKSPKAKEYIKTRLSGSTQSYLTLNSLREFPVLCPDIETQKDIVNILSSFDDKIELNRRINENLEQQAQALFKSWFVDFEPFKDGKFVDSELGKIPKGWKVGTLDDVGEIVGGGTPSKAEPLFYCDNGISWITPKDLSINQSKYISKGKIDITEIGYKNSSAKKIPAGSVLFSSRAPIGYIAIAGNEVTTNQGFKSVVPQKAGTCFIYLFLKYNMKYIESQATGSTFKEVSGSLMKSQKLIIPVQYILDEFENKLNSVFSMQCNLESENQCLIQIRDILIPKLMSGELKINSLNI